jgi:hypothetical protein
MGWLDKTFKNIIKSPVGKAAIGAAALKFGGPGIMNLLKNPKVLGTLGKSLWAKPIISKPLTNAAMSYGLAKLMRSRNPEKAAMWGALSTLPFLGSEAYGYAADATKAGNKMSMWDVLLGKQAPGKLTPDVLKNLSEIDKAKYARIGGFDFPGTSYDFKSALDKGYGLENAMDFNYFMKSPTELAAMNAKDATGMAAFLPKSKFDILNTFVPMMAGTYGGRETDAQMWERKRKQRIQQLAWMYGVDPSQITGEMTNPWYDNTPPALDWKYANRGGIMELPTGGAISGPGTGTSDSINARVSNGEFIFTDKAIENLGGGDHTEGTKIAYSMMNQLDPQSQTAAEGMV